MSHRIAAKIKHRVRKIPSAHSALQAASFGRQYRNNLSVLQRVRRSPDTAIAVVVHLYYAESWPLIADALASFRPPFDLFVTLPEANGPMAGTIKQSYKTATIITVPNRGRDVLPFLRVAEKLGVIGYSYVLKVHSKKSTHRTDGADWFSGMLKSLVPKGVDVQTQLLETLSHSDTGIIGPEDQYLPLSVNFEANGMHMTEALNKLYPKATTYDVLQKNRSDYGFFAGTMFWARLDALAPILQLKLSATRFEIEQGQIDATFAHALERVFSLVSEIENKKLYEISPGGIRQIEYASDNVPDWSDVYIEPKPDP